MNKPVPNYNPATDPDLSGYLIHVGHVSFEVDGDTPFSYVMDKLEEAVTASQGQVSVQIFRIESDSGINADPLISTVIERH
jgi:hypothetical protein